MDEKRRVLIVDDEQLLREMYSDFLEQSGFVVSNVSTGEEALSEVRVFNPDIILIDIVLRDMSGFDLYNQIRLFDRDVPIIFMTAYQYDARISEKLEKTKARCFYKPAQLSDILALINSELGIK